MPELIFGTLCASAVIPACGTSGTTSGRKDGGAGTGGFQGVAAGGFAGSSVAAGGFQGVAAGGFGGFAGSSVAAGGFAGVQGVAAGGFAGLPGVAAGGFGGTDAGPEAELELDAPSEWAVLGAFGELEAPYATAARRPKPQRAGRRVRRRKR